MNKIISLVWLVTIGTNAAHYYSDKAAYQGITVLAGIAYFLFIFRGQFLRLIFFKEYLFLLFMLICPILLMLLSNRSFERGAYTSLIIVAMVFTVASVLALRAELDRTLSIAAFVIVVIGVALNLYEFLIENNLWSTAPGRSAGLYINPNISAGALLGYGLIFLSSRADKFRIDDLIMMCLIVVGVFITFSRTGIISVVVLFTAVILLRVNRRYFLRVIAGSVSIMVIAVVGSSYVYQNMVLSKDAAMRLDSFMLTSLLDNYRSQRGEVALDSIDLFMKNPIAGEGVRTVQGMTQGPHNMFVAVMIDYGVSGLLAYLGFIVRLILFAIISNREIAGRLWLFILWLCLFSVASHNLLEDTATMPILGFALARTYQIHNFKGRSSNDT